MFSVVVANLDEVQLRETVQLSVAGTQPDELLRDWLAELLYIFEARRLLLARFEVTIGAEGLTATAQGEPIDTARHQLDVEVKAITWHGLKVDARRRRLAGQGDRRYLTPLGGGATFLRGGRRPRGPARGGDNRLRVPLQDRLPLQGGVVQVPAAAVGGCQLGAEGGRGVVQPDYFVLFLPIAAAANDDHNLGPVLEPLLDLLQHRLFVGGQRRRLARLMGGPLRNHRGRRRGRWFGGSQQRRRPCFLGLLLVDEADAGPIHFRMDGGQGAQ